MDVKKLFIRLSEKIAYKVVKIYSVLLSTIRTSLSVAISRKMRSCRGLLRKPSFIVYLEFPAVANNPRSWV